MAVCPNGSAVSETFSSVNLAQINMPPFSLPFSSAGHRDRVYMSEWDEFLICDWLLRYFAFKNDWRGVPKKVASECISILSKGLTLLWYPEWLRVSWQDLMHDPAELIEHLQALLLPHTGVVEARESWLEREHKVMQHCQETNVASRGCQLVRLLYFSAGKHLILKKILE